MRYVLIGDSFAATSAIEGIRSRDKEGEILVINKEEEKAYYRPLISYVLYGKSKLENIYQRDDKFYQDNKVQFMLGTEALSLDPVEKTVTLDNGKVIDYDKVLVSTGSRPFVPAMKGLEKVKYKYSFMTIADMKKLEKAVKPTSRVLIFGSGLIGLKAAEGLLHRCQSITVVDMADRVLPSILDQGAGEIVKSQLEEAGLSFELKTTADHFEENTAYLLNGKVIDFDILLLCVGVRANVSLVKDAGGEVDRGIIVNKKLETSIPDVYAAGDCTQGFELTTKTNRVIAIIPNANLQGRTAGINMAGGDESFNNPIAMNAIGFFGSHIVTAGVYEGEEETIRDEKGYKKFYTKDGKLTGMILMGDYIDRAGIYTALIRNETELSDIDWNMLKEKPLLAAFALTRRKEMLAREV